MAMFFNSFTVYISTQAKCKKFYLSVSAA